MWLQLRTIVVTLCILGGVFASMASSAPSLACVTDTIGLDSSFGNRSSGALLGEGIGETFVAGDTLLEFLRVWRIASETGNFNVGIHPYIIETTALGAPDPSQVIWDGPRLVIPDGDGVHPIEFNWSFDPPLRLPHPGLYAFFLFQAPCVAYFDLLTTDRPDLYSDGAFWMTGRSSCILYPQIHLEYYPQGDLVFQIGFCRDYVTTSRRLTWGELKMLYR